MSGFLPIVCPLCDTELNNSQSQTQSKCGPRYEVIVTWTWNTVSCPDCGYIEYECAETNLKMEHV